MNPFENSRTPWLANSEQILRKVEVVHRQEFWQAIAVVERRDGAGKTINIMDCGAVVWSCTIDPDACVHLAKLLTKGLD